MPTATCYIKNVRVSLDYVRASYRYRIYYFHLDATYGPIIISPRAPQRFSDMTLDEAYRYLTTIRPCGPNRDAIRGATCDLAHGGHHQHNFERCARAEPRAPLVSP